MNEKNDIPLPNFRKSPLRRYEMCDGEVDYELKQKALIELGLISEFPIRCGS